MNPRELREMNEVELQEKEREIREELFHLRFKLKAGQLDNTARIRAIKKDIARILTIRREGRT